MTGHLKAEETPVFQLPFSGSCFQVLRHMIIPGIDALERDSGNNFYPRIAHSLSEQFADGEVFVEAFGGSGWGISPEDLINYLKWLIGHGGTCITLHLNHFVFKSSAIRDDWPASLPCHVTWRDAFSSILDKIRNFAKENNILSGEAELLIITPTRGIMEEYEPWEILKALLAAGLHGIKRVAVASSDCALGFTYSKNRPLPVYLPVDEGHPLKLDDTYGLSKIVSEEIAEAMSQRFNMSIASLRITHVMTQNSYRRESFKKWQQDSEEGPWNLWSYIDSRDAARAFRLAIENDLKGHEIFFITAEDTRSLIKSEELIEKYFPKADIITGFKGYETLENIEKAKKILNFFPKYSWRDILIT